MLSLSQNLENWEKMPPQQSSIVWYWPKGSLQEEKLRIRQEKEKQIEELQEQITARQKEQRSLRTNWMVYDKIKLNQLNQEIEGLEKQIAALQKELSE